MNRRITCLFLLCLLSLFLLTACQKQPEPSGSAAETTYESVSPWESAQQEASMSYDVYFAEVRPYDPADDAPDWMKEGNYAVLLEDGVLSLYQDTDGTLTRVLDYPVEAPLGWSTALARLYAFDAQTIYRLDYGGKAAEPIYRVTGGAIMQMTAAGDALFFAEKTDDCIKLCRLYAPEARLDVLYDRIPADAERFQLLTPVSNHEARWCMADPAFVQLAEEQRQQYMETYGHAVEDQSTYWGMLELDFDTTSGIRYTYNDLTKMLDEQNYRMIYGDCGEADNTAAPEQLGFAGANIGQGGLMAGDGEWVYYRSESDWGLYKARTDGSERTQLLPPEDYAPNCINVLDGWAYFSNYRDGFSLWRVRTDGSKAEKLVDGYCYTFLVTESGIYFDCRDENNVMRTFHAELDGSAQTLLYEGCTPDTYYEDTLYLYDFRSGTLYAYNTEAKEREILFEGKYNAAYFSADDTGVYFWDDMCDYCHLDPETKEITVLHQGPIGDYFNYYDGTVYYVAYGGENYDYDCCYAMDVKTGEQKAILSLSTEMYDAFGDPIGITQVDYRDGNYDADSIPTNEEGWPMALNELADGLFVVNGQVFARARLARTGMAETWVLCDGGNGTVWG